MNAYEPDRLLKRGNDNISPDEDERINEVIDKLISRHQKLSNGTAQRNENSIESPSLKLKLKNKL